MEAKKTTVAAANVREDGTGPSEEGYVSPEVQSARQGEQVEFGHDLNATDESDNN